MIDFDKSYINRLLYFYYVATCKNISHAAHEAGLHQSAMSRQMIKLEKELGMELLRRTSEGVNLTRKGEALFRSTEKMLMELGAGRKKLQEEEEEISGKIKICTTYAIANYILGEPLFGFQRLYPEIEIEIIGNDYTIDIIKNNVDIVVRPYDPDADYLIQEPLFNLQAKLYASPGYIKKYGYPKTKNDLSQHKFIACSRAEKLPFNPDTINWFLNIEGCTSEKNCVFRTNIIESRFRAAERDIGIISVYENMDILQKSGLIQVAPEVHGTLYQEYFSYSKQLQGMSKLEKLRDHLQNYFKEKGKNIK